MKHVYIKFIKSKSVCRRVAKELRNAALDRLLHLRVIDHFHFIVHVILAFMLFHIH